MPTTINLDIYALRSFVKGVELGSFSRAAVAVGRSPAALSGQMRKLEMQVGEVLFCKSGRGLTLTPAGEVLLGYARTMLAMNDEAVGAIRAARVDGIVRIGLPADFAESWLPQILGQFASDYPLVQVKVLASRSAELIDLVATGQLDFALAWGSPHGNVIAREVTRVAPGWIVAHGAQPSFNRSDVLPMVVFDPPCIFRQRALEALNEHGLRWRISFVSPSLPALWSAVHAGLGMTVRTAFTLPSNMTMLDPVSTGLPALPPVPLSLHQSSAHLSTVAKSLQDLIVTNLAPSKTMK